jgi:hypothetical protein
MSYDNDAEANELVRREAARRGISETMYRMLKVAPTDVVQSIVWDHVGRADATRPSSIISTPSDRAAPKRGTGWVEARPLGKQPGIDLIDQMVENQTARERIATADEQMRAALARKEFEEKFKKKD